MVNSRTEIVKINNKCFFFLIFIAVLITELLRYLCGSLHVRGHGGHPHGWRHSHHPVRNWRGGCIRVISVVVTAVLIIAPPWIVTAVGLLIVLLLIVAVVAVILVVVTA